MASVLVVDDEESIRDFLSEVLGDAGHRVSRAADGVEALALLRREAFDLMLTDLRMPRMTGLELLKAAREVRPELRSLVLSAHGTIDQAVEAMKLGALDFIEKPVESPAALRATVAGALRFGASASTRERDRDRGEAGARPTPKPSGPRITFGDPAMRGLMHDVSKVAATHATVLLLGESGSGKEVVAREVHRLSTRASGPFVAINCAALSETLIESELFGHERGAFTGAHERREGRLQQADGGTFFLDEVAEMKLELQAKLLRVLQERCFERVGGNQTLHCDVRWIAATHRDLAARVADGSFREDLYYRLSVFPIRVPPLRERRDDIPPIAESLLSEFASLQGRPALVLDTDAKRALLSYGWPGNVRELKNVLERASIVAEGGVVRVSDLRLDAAPSGATARGAASQIATSSAAPSPAVAEGGLPTSDPSDPQALGVQKPVGGSLEELEVSAIRTALAAEGGHRKRAAQRLGIGLRTLYEKIRRYGL